MVQQDVEDRWAWERIDKAEADLATMRETARALAVALRVLVNETYWLTVLHDAYNAYVELPNAVDERDRLAALLATPAVRALLTEEAQ